MGLWESLEVWLKLAVGSRASPVRNLFSTGTSLRARVVTRRVCAWTCEHTGTLWLWGWISMDVQDGSQDVQRDRENQSSCNNHYGRSPPTFVLTMAHSVEPRNCHCIWMYLFHVTTKSSFCKPPNEYQTKVSEILEWLILSTLSPWMDNPFHCP